MSDTEIRRVDPADEALLRAIWEVGSAVAAETPWAHDFPEWRAALRTWTVPVSTAERRLWCAYVAGVPAGYAEAEIPLSDNTHLVEVYVGVAAAHRRVGLGSALLEAVAEEARSRDRSVLMTGFNAGFDGVGPGQGFAEARGFELAQFDVEKVLDVPAHLADWPRLLADVEQASAAYRIVDWIGPCPDEHLDALCALASGFVGEIPLGDLALENEHWDERRVREHDARHAASGRYDLTTLAYAPDGSPAGYTTVIARRDADYAFQDATLVVPAHRGHRLGLRLKLLNQLALVEHFPHVRTIETGNAGDNDHMNAVNEQLGFRPVGRWLEMQRRL